jgi:hypothetical protein
MTNGLVKKVQSPEAHKSEILKSLKEILTVAVRIILTVEKSVSAYNEQSDPSIGISIFLLEGDWSQGNEMLTYLSFK